MPVIMPITKPDDCCFKSTNGAYYTNTIHKGRGQNTSAKLELISFKIYNLHTTHPTISKSAITAWMEHIQIIKLNK
jgi:hypothetical protein